MPEEDNYTIAVGMLAILASPFIFAYYKIKSVLLRDRQ